MPELPEVEVVRRDLDREVPGELPGCRSAVMIADAHEIEFAEVARREVRDIGIRSPVRGFCQNRLKNTADSCPRMRAL